MGFGKVKGLHFDDPRMAPLLERCGDLGLPVNIHVADPIWMYQKMDETNDGHDERRRLAARRQARHRRPRRHGRHPRARPCARHPRTTFVACHFANLDYDLARLGRDPRRRCRTCTRTSRPATRRRPSSRASPRASSALPGPPRLRHRHGRRRGHVPAHLPHPGDARRATSTRRSSTTTGATAASRSRTRCSRSSYRANALAGRDWRRARPGAGRSRSRVRCRAVRDHRATLPARWRRQEASDARRAGGRRPDGERGRRQGGELRDGRALRRREAAARGVALALFPECCLTGYWFLRQLDRAAARARSPSRSPTARAASGCSRSPRASG